MHDAPFINVQGMSEGLWGATVTGGRDDIEAMPSSSERVLRKQVSALQVGLTFTPLLPHSLEINCIIIILYLHALGTMRTHA